MNAPLKFTSWLTCPPCSCSTPSSTSSRTLPAWPKPPDPPGSLAPSSSAHRNSSSGDHAGADDCLPQANMEPTQTTFSRTAETKNLSMHGNGMLAPMGLRRDDGGEGWSSSLLSRFYIPLAASVTAWVKAPCGSLEMTGSEPPLSNVATVRL